jgi:hypothetical protein
MSGRGWFRQPFQEIERVKTRRMPISPYGLDSIATHAGNSREPEGGRRESDFRSFMDLSQDIHLAFAASAGAGTA